MSQIELSKGDAQFLLNAISSQKFEFPLKDILNGIKVDESITSIINKLTSITMEDTNIDPNTEVTPETTPEEVPSEETV